MLPKKKKYFRFSRQVTDDVPASLKRRPYAYTQLSPVARKEDEKKAKEARKPLCPHCGAAVKKSQKYCPACGMVLKEENK